MADDKYSRNRQKVFDLLKTEGYNDIGDSADELFKDKYNSELAYKLLTEAGYTGLAKDYNEFASKLYAPESPAQEPAVTSAAPGRITSMFGPETSSFADAPISVQKNEAQRVAQESAAAKAREEVERQEAVKAEEEAYRKGYADLADTYEKAREANAPIIEEYERRKAELYQQGSDRDYAFIQSETKWLQDNKAAYDAAKQRIAAAKAPMDEYQGLYNLEHKQERLAGLDQKIQENKQAQRAVRDRSKPGSPDYDAVSAWMEHSDEDDYTRANEILRMAKQTYRQSSKYEGYEGNWMQDIWNGAKQFVKDGVNNIDRGSFTFGISEGDALSRAREIGDKNNEIISAKLKDIGVDDRTVSGLIDGLNTKVGKLNTLVQELEAAKGEFDAMEATYKDMVARGGSPDEINSLGKELNRLAEDLNKRIEKEYNPLVAEVEQGQSRYESIMSAVDSAVDEGLKPGEKAVLDAFEEFVKAQEARDGDVSVAGAAGAGFEQTLEFMLDFVLTKGLGTAGEKAATKLLTKRLLKKMGKDALSTPVKLGFGARFATDVAVSGARTALMFPRSIGAYGEQLTQLSDELGIKDEFGRYNFKRSQGNALLNTALTQYIEYWSEGFGEYFGAAEKALFRSTTMAAPTAAIGRTLAQYRGSIGKYLDYSKFDGQFNETLEEVVGSGLNALAGWLSGDRVGDKEAMKQFFAGEQLATLSLSFLPMSAISAFTNIKAYNRMKNRYDRAVIGLDPFVKSGAISQQELDGLVSGIKEMTPVQIKDKIVELADKARGSNHGHLPANFAQNLLGYIEGSFAMNLDNETWMDQQQKMRVVDEYAAQYSAPDKARAYDNAQRVRNAEEAAIAAGVDQDTLDLDAYQIARHAENIAESDPDKAEAMMQYAEALSAWEGMRDGYDDETAGFFRNYTDMLEQKVAVNGKISMAYSPEGTPVYIISKDATVGEDGTITTPSGKDGMVQYMGMDGLTVQTARASDFSGAFSEDFDTFVMDQEADFAEKRRQEIEQAENTISPLGMSDALAERKGQTVYISGSGAYEPVVVERVRNMGETVVISGDKNALAAVAQLAGIQSPGSNRLEIPVAKLYPLLAKEDDGSISTDQPEGAPAPAATPETQQPAPAAPQEAPQDNLADLVGKEVDVTLDGTPRRVLVENVSGGRVDYSFEDENGDPQQRYLSEDEFRAAMGQTQPAAPAPAAPAPAPAPQNPTPAPAASAGNIPTNDAGKKVYDDPSVTPEMAYDDLYRGAEQNPKREENADRFVIRKSDEARKALKDAQDQIAKADAEKAEIDNWDIKGDEDLDDLERRQNEAKAKVDERVAQTQAELPELQRKAAFWEDLRAVAEENVKTREEEAKRQALIAKYGVDTSTFDLTPQSLEEAVADMLSRFFKNGGRLNYQDVRTRASLGERDLLRQGWKGVLSKDGISIDDFVHNYLAGDPDASAFVSDEQAAADAVIAALRGDNRAALAEKIFNNRLDAAIKEKEYAAGAPAPKPAAAPEPAPAPTPAPAPEPKPEGPEEPQVPQASQDDALVENETQEIREAVDAIVSGKDTKKREIKNTLPDDFTIGGKDINSYIRERYDRFKAPLEKRREEIRKEYVAYRTRVEDEARADILKKNPHIKEDNPYLPDYVSEEADKRLKDDDKFKALDAQIKAIDQEIGDYQTRRYNALAAVEEIYEKSQKPAEKPTEGGAQNGGKTGGNAGDSGKKPVTSQVPGSPAEIKDVAGARAYFENLYGKGKRADNSVRVWELTHKKQSAKKEESDGDISRMALNLYEQTGLSAEESSELVNLGTQLAGDYIEEDGYVKFAQFFKNLVATFGDGIRPFAPQLYLGAMANVSDETLQQMDDVVSVRGFDTSIDINTINDEQESNNDVQPESGTEQPVPGEPPVAGSDGGGSQGESGADVAGSDEGGSPEDSGEGGGEMGELDGGNDSGADSGSDGAGENGIVGNGERGGRGSNDGGATRNGSKRNRVSGRPASQGEGGGRASSVTESEEEKAAKAKAEEDSAYESEKERIKDETDTNKLKSLLASLKEKIQNFKDKFDIELARLNGRIRAVREKLNSLFSAGVKKSDILAQEKVQYTPVSDPTGEHAIGSVVPSGAAGYMRDAVARLEKEVGKTVAEYVKDELGYSSLDEMYSNLPAGKNDGLAAEQVDAVGLAIHQMKTGRMFIVGDMTGVGKGRVGAALIRWAKKSGKKVIFCTEKPGLFSAMYNDIADIGGLYQDGKANHTPVPWIMNNDSSANITDEDENIVVSHPSSNEADELYASGKDELPVCPGGRNRGNIKGKQYDFVMTTYSQLQASESEEEGDSERVKKKNERNTKGRRRLNWLKNYAKGAIVIMDESHTAAGEGSTRGENAKKIVEVAQGVTFMSATFAKTPESMGLYAVRSSMNDAMITREQLIQAISHYGIPMQEILAASLFKTGEMVRRERDTKGLKTNWLQPDEIYTKDEIQTTRSLSDKTVGVVNAVIDFQRRYVEPIIRKLNKELEERNNEESASGKKDIYIKKYESTPYSGQVSNVFSMMLFALKAKKAAEVAIEQIKRGEKPVIAVDNTLGAYVDQVEGNVDSADFGAVLMKGLAFAKRYQLTTTHLRFNEQKGRYEPVAGDRQVEKFQSIEDRFGENALAEMESLSDKISAYGKETLAMDLPLSPIDYIKKKISDAGYRCGEITGRKNALVQNQDGTWKKEARKQEKTKVVVNKFNGGKVGNPLPKEDTYDAVIMNRSGATGNSMHSSSRYGDQRPRKMIILQAAKNPDEEVQIRGRIDRTGQVSRGEYFYIVSPIPAEKKITMMLRQKLASLDATSVGTENVSTNKVNAEDMDNKYGDEVARDFLVDHEEIHSQMDPGKQMRMNNKTREYVGRPGLLYDLLLSIQRMTCDEQEMVLSELEEAYTQKIEYLNQNGINDLSTTTMNLEATTVDSAIMVKGKDNDSLSEFAHDTTIERVEVNVLRKPLRSSDIAKKMRELGATSADGTLNVDYADDIRKKALEAERELLAEKKQKQDESEKSLESDIRAQIPKEGSMTEEQYDAAVQADPRLSALKLRNANEYARYQNQLREQILQVGRAVAYLKPGRAYLVPLNESEEAQNMYGRFLGFKLGKDGKPKSIEAVFATKDSRAMVSIPVVNMHNVIDRIIDQSAGFYDLFGKNDSEYGSEKERLATYDQWWDKMIPENTSRAIRYMITGNILQAAGSLGAYRGSIVTFTRKDPETGEITVDKGLLLAEDFDPENFMVRTAVTKEDVWENAGEFSDELTNIAVHRDGDKLIVKFTRPRGSRAKLSNHPVMADEDFKALCDGGEIIPQSADELRAIVSENNVEAALEYLYKNYGFTQGHLLILPDSTEKPDLIVYTGKPYQEVIDELKGKYKVYSAERAQEKIREALKTFRMDVNNEELKARIRELVQLRQAYLRSDYARLDNADLAWQVIVMAQRIEQLERPVPGETADDAIERKKTREDAFNRMEAYKEELESRGFNKGHLMHFKQGKTDLDTIEKIFDEFNSDKENARLAKKVFAIIRRLSVNVFFDEKTGNDTGGYTAGDLLAYNWRFMNEDWIPDQLKANTILHEMIHTATVYAVRAIENGADHLIPGLVDAVNQANALYREIRSSASLRHQLGESSWNSYTDYGAKNVKEMLAEAGSNASFREDLSKIKILVQRQTSFGQTVFRFTDVSKEEHPEGNVMTGLQVATDILERLLDGFNADAYRKMWAGTGYGEMSYNKADDILFREAEKKKNTNFVSYDRNRTTPESNAESSQGELGAIQRNSDRRRSEGVGRQATASPEETTRRNLEVLNRGLAIEREKYLAERNSTGGDQSNGANRTAQWNAGRGDEERRASEALIRLAKDNKLFIDASEVNGRYGRTFDEQGAESITFISPDGKVFTKFKNPFEATWKFDGSNHTRFDVLHEVSAHNILFSNIPYTFVGITEINGLARIILQQKAVKNDTSINGRQARAYMLGRGFDVDRWDRSKSNNGKVGVMDLVGGNAFVDENGTVSVFDPIIKFLVEPENALRDLDAYGATIDGVSIQAKSAGHPAFAEYTNAVERFDALRNVDEDAAYKEMYNALQSIYPKMNGEQEEYLKGIVENILAAFPSLDYVVKDKKTFSDLVDDSYSIAAAFVDVPTKEDTAKYKPNINTSTAGGRITAAELQATNETLDRMSQGLGIQINRVPRSAMPAGHQSDKGYYNPATGEMTICMDNVTDERDAVATVLHETVGHHGLRKLLGDKFNEAMVRIHAALDAKGRRWVNSYMQRHGLQPGDSDAIIRGMEEYLSHLAESGDFKNSVWDDIKEILGRIIDAIFGTDGFVLTDREMNYILRASYENLKDPNWLNTVQGRAKDTLMKRALGINETDPNRPTDPDGPGTGILYRDGETSARSEYEEIIARTGNVIIRENQNADLPVKIGMDEIMKEVGRDKDSLTDEEDYLTRHNIASSRAESQSHEFELFFFRPMLDKVREVRDRLISGKSTKGKRQEAYNRAMDYMYAVSGLERNRYKNNEIEDAKQEALRNAREDAETKQDDLRAEGASKAELDAVDKALAEKEKDITDRYESMKKDWSGLTSLTGRPASEWREAEADAQDMVDAFRDEVNDDDLLDALWDSVRACTDFSLDHAYKYGLLTRDEYERLHGTDTQPRMWNYYLPLRGFEEETAEDAYGYASFVNPSSNSVVVKKMEGRKTRANNPLANILNIAETEIVQGNDNWARQALYNFTLRSGENSLLSVSEPWYVKDAATGLWVMAEPRDKESLEAFEERMRAEREADPKRVKKGRRGLRLDRIMANPAHKNEHSIRLRVGGVDKMIWVNGDPALARAVTGFGRKMNWEFVRRASRAVSNLFTTYSLDFTVKNLIRDTVYSRIAMKMKEDRKYRHKFTKNWIRNFGYGAFALPMVRLSAQWESGKLQQKEHPTRKEQMFMDFMRDGGQTGYTIVNSVREIKKQLENDMRRAGGSGRNFTLNPFKIYGVAVKTLNEAYELLTRFTAYETSREVGRSGQRSALDAKEISVNFNRRGAQSGEGPWGFFAAYLGATHYFYNAGVQGFDNFLRLFKVAPLKMTATTVGIAMMGMAAPMINALLAGLAEGEGGDGDGNDDWYWNLPEWVRRNNFVLGTGKFYFAFPLPVEFRAFYGLGDIAGSAFVYNKYPDRKFGNVALDMISMASGILPFNPIEGYNGGGNLGDTVLRSVAPDAGMFLVDYATNRDYTGRPLAKENPFTKTVPKVQGAYASTPKALVELCQKIGEQTGWDIPPGVLRDLFNNYGGGFYRVAEDLAKRWYTDEEHPKRWDDIPFLSGFTGHIDEDRSKSFAQGALHDYKEISDKVVRDINLRAGTKDISVAMAYGDINELPEDVRSRVAVQRILSGKDYELGKMYREGMNKQHTGKFEYVVSKKDGSLRKKEIMKPGVDALRKTWNDLKDVWAKMPDKTEEEKAAKARAYAAVTDAWHDYYNAQGDLAEKLLEFEFGERGNRYTRAAYRFGKSIRGKAKDVKDKVE